MNTLPPPPPPPTSPVGGTTSSGRGTNGLAIASLVVSLTCCGPIGMILGFVALSQIKKSGEQGRGMAIAGVVIGILSSVVAVGWIVISVMLGFLDQGYY
jgi:hypothetical protein